MRRALFFLPLPACLAPETGFTSDINGAVGVAATGAVTGPIHVETPEGSALAGDFPAPWRLSTPLPAEIGTTVLGSISVSAGHLVVPW